MKASIAETVATSAGSIVLDHTHIAVDPMKLPRGEFEAWEAVRGRGMYDVIHDCMRFRVRNRVYRVELPVRFDTQIVAGIVYGLASDIEQHGRLV